MKTFGLGLLVPIVLAACGGDGDPAPDANASTGDPQTPPTGKAAVEAWIAKADYKAWACEPGVHAARSPSPHGFNRICSNNSIANNVGGSADWPQGAAAVKELYASMTAATPMGYAVYLKRSPDSAAGANWYWYERIDTSVIADGEGNAGSAKSICVGCHAAAGIDAAHTPTAGARDLVYSPIL